MVQHAYLNAYAHLRLFDGHARFADWLTRIVNDVLAALRSRASSPPPLMHSPSGRRDATGWSPPCSGELNDLS